MVLTHCLSLQHTSWHARYTDICRTSHAARKQPGQLQWHRYGCSGHELAASRWNTQPVRASRQALPDDDDVEEDLPDVDDDADVLQDADLDALADDDADDDEQTEEVAEAFERRRKARVVLDDDEDEDEDAALLDSDMDMLGASGLGEELEDDDGPLREDMLPRTATRPREGAMGIMEPFAGGLDDEEGDEEAETGGYEEEEEEDAAAHFPPRPERQYRLQELLLKSGYEEAAQVVAEASVTGLQDDPSRVQQGDLFFVPATDGQPDGDFAQQAAALAVERGAAALLSESLLPDSVGVPYVMVDDVEMAAQKLAVAFYDHPSKRMTTIGILGSAGKTTTAWLLRGIFEEVEQRVGMMGTIEYALENALLDVDGDVWVPDQEDTTKNRDCTQPFHLAPYEGKYPLPPTTPNGLHCQKVLAGMADRQADVAIVELSIEGLLAGVDTDIDFDVLVFCNVLLEQVELAGLSVEEYVRAIAQVFSRLDDPKRHRAVLNMDDPHVGAIVEQLDPAIPQLGYSMDKQAGSLCWIDKLRYVLFETEVLVRTPVVKLQIKSMLLGRQNVYNLLAAVSAGLPFMVPDSPVTVQPKAIVTGLEAVEVIPGRCEVLDEGQGFPVVVDYARTPAALARLLDSFREIGAKTIWLVMGAKGCELEHLRPYMGEVAHFKADWVFVTNDNPRTDDPSDIVHDICAGFPEWVHRFESSYPYLTDPLNVPEQFWTFMWGYQSAVKKYIVEDRHSAIRCAIAMAGAKDVVVVVGKGHEDYEEHDDGQGNVIRGWFDDRVECKDALMNLPNLNSAKSVDRKEIPFTRYPEEREDYPARTEWIPSRFLQGATSVPDL